MNNRKQGSNGCVDTLEDEEQIRRMVSFQVQEIVDEDRHRVPRTGTGGCIGEEEDEEETLRMTQKVSISLNEINRMDMC